MFRLVIVSVAILILGGMVCVLACGNPELDKVRGQLRASNAENDILRLNLSELQGRYIDLQAAHENLTALHAELKQWSEELVTSLGPSLWVPGVYERPVPVRCFQDEAPAQELVDALNHYFDANQLPRFALIGVHDRTAVVRIISEAQLTQNMGTTGAQGYLGAVTYTLSSLEGVDCVDFKFEPGSHAIPGPHCR